LVLALVAGGWDEWPQWRIGGAAPLPAASLSSGRERLACPASGSRIAIYGDSHVAGNGGATVPFGRVMQKALRLRLTADLRGAGGDTAEMGEQRWLATAQPEAVLVILAYGTNDAAPRGWLGGKQPVPIPGFTNALRRQIDFWQARGAQAVLMAPPPGSSSAMAERLAPYRNAVSSLGKESAIAVLDPADAFARCAGSAPLLGYDGLHLSGAGHRCLGTWLAGQLCPGGS
jgi:lysophospholipase L1-like esterase